jgi:hypothetical protein
MSSGAEWFGSWNLKRSNSMKIQTTLKSLSLLGLTAMTLAAAPSQANDGYGYNAGPPNPNPWYGGAPNPNPWVVNPAYQQYRYAATLKQRLEQLDQRQDAQMLRILKGMENGKLTSREAVVLLREHLAIANLERRYLADGRLGPNELANLEQRLAEAERHITFEQRDREKNAPTGRPGNGGHPGDYDRR